MYLLLLSLLFGLLYFFEPEWLQRNWDNNRRHEHNEHNSHEGHSGHSGHNRHPGRCKEKDVGYIVLASFVIAIIVCFILCFCLGWTCGV